MSTHYVLLADAARARIFRGGPLLDDLVEVEDLVHPESRAHTSELVTDSKGSTRSGPGGAHAGMEGPDAHREEARRFARELAEHLRRALHDQRFDKLILVAPPRFLGQLRGALDKPTATCVVASIPKDLTKVDARDLGQALQRDLARKTS